MKKYVTLESILYCAYSGGVDCRPRDREFDHVAVPVFDRGSGGGVVKPVSPAYLAFRKFIDSLQNLQLYY